MAKRPPKTGKRRRRSAAKRVAFAAVAIALVLVFQELLFRAFFPLPELSNFNRFVYQTLGDVNRRHLYVRTTDMTWKSVLDTPETFVHRLNSYGFRDRDWRIAKARGQSRWFFVGDSFVEGMMARQADTVPAVFAARADADGKPAEVMNFGIMGVGLQSYMNLLTDAVPIFLPDHVVLVLYANDVPFQENVEPRPPRAPTYFNRLAPRIKEVLALRRAGEMAPRRWLRPSRGYYQPVPHPANPWSKDEAALSAKVTPRVAAAMKRAEFNYYRAEWVLNEEDYLKRPTDLTTQLQYISSLCAEHGAALHLVYVPSRHQVSTYYYEFEHEMCLACPEELEMTQDKYQVHAASLARSCAVLGIPFLDLTPPLRAAEAADQHLYWDYDDHMRPAGYRLLADAIYNWLK